MKRKTAELLYLLLWSCEMLSQPTFRNLTESFEGWACRNGFLRRLNRLECHHCLESAPKSGDLSSVTSHSTQRILRLTEAGRLRALGGRDPEACWNRPWNGYWRLTIFDLPMKHDRLRRKLRQSLRRQHFGYLQDSVWISPDSHEDHGAVRLGREVDVESLILFTARPCAGESDAEIVAGAWDFKRINEYYSLYMRILANRPTGNWGSHAAAESFRNWASREHSAWLDAIQRDPLLPLALLPSGYLGREAWYARVKTQEKAAKQLDSFSGFLWR